MIYFYKSITLILYIRKSFALFVKVIKFLQISTNCSRIFTKQINADKRFILTINWVWAICFEFKLFWLFVHCSCILLWSAHVTRIISTYTVHLIICMLQDKFYWTLYLRPTLFIIVKITLCYWVITSYRENLSMTTSWPLLTFSLFQAIYRTRFCKVLEKYKSHRNR